MQVIKQNGFLSIAMALSMCSSIAGAQEDGKAEGVVTGIDQDPWDTPSRLALFTARQTSVHEMPFALHEVALALFHAGKETRAGEMVVEMNEALKSSRYRLDQGTRPVDLRNVQSTAQLEMNANFKEFNQRRRRDMVVAFVANEEFGRDRSKQYALYKQVNAHVQSGGIDKAKVVANGMTDPYHRAHALILIADQEDEASAVLTLNKALVAVEMIQEPRESSSDKSFTLCALAGAFAKVGETEQAMSVANRIETESKYVSVRTRIAMALAERGKRSEALAALEQALGGARYDSDLTRCAKAFAKLGERERAIATLEQALAKPTGSAKSRYEIGWEFGKLGEEARALEAINQAIEVVAQAEGRLHELKKAGTLPIIGDILLNLGHEELALKTLGQSILKDAALQKAKLAMILATEITGDDYLGERRMKESFTPSEKRFAKRLVELGR